MPKYVVARGSDEASEGGVNGVKSPPRNTRLPHLSDGDSSLSVPLPGSGRGSAPSTDEQATASTDKTTAAPSAINPRVVTCALLANPCWRPSEHRSDAHPEAINSPVGDHLLRGFEARELLDGLGDDALLDLRPRVAPETRLEQQFTPAPEGWAPGEAQLRLTGGLPLDLAVDTDVANLLVRCDGGLPLRELLAGAATATGAPADTVARKGAAATRHLIEAGFLLPR
jgi:hypothetical protein